MNYFGFIKAGVAAALLISLSDYGFNAMVPRESGGPWLGIQHRARIRARLGCTRGCSRAAGDAGVKTALLATVICLLVAGGLTITSAIGWVWSLASMAVAGVLVAKLYREPEAPPSGD